MARRKKAAAPVRAPRVAVIKPRVVGARNSAGPARGTEAVKLKQGHIDKG